MDILLKCFKKSHRDCVEGLKNDHAIGGKRTDFFKELTSTEKRKLHKVYVDGWRKWQFQNQKIVDDSENGFSEPDEKYQ